jgi:DNA (cytosine-5)-methyltransferase 1
MTLGSLFDGSGGFPLAGQNNGITPVWASEIEPFPICVTRKNFPDMKHLGDIHKINGGKIPPVDIITFGSPCQSFSVAGNGEGLEGKSGLLFEAIRVIREMREATNGKYPRYVVWENVKGVLSNQKDKSFEVILGEFAKLKDPAISLPRPAGGKYSNAGEILADGFSLSWRVLNAKFWGVPQNRERVFLVLDFRGESAGEILFDESRLQRDITPRGSEEFENSAGTKRSFREAISIEHNSTAGRIKIRDEDTTQTLLGRAGTRGEPPLTAIAINIKQDPVSQVECAPCITKGAENGEADIGVAIGIDKFTFNQGKNAAYKPQFSKELSNTLTAKSPNAVYQRKIGRIRKLTPLECCRLQGFPDGYAQNLGVDKLIEADVAFWRKVWDEYCAAFGKKRKTIKQIVRFMYKPHSDSQEYKIWGNGIALPCAEFVLGGIVEAEERKII